jgi:hypothetical protein
MWMHHVHILQAYDTIKNQLTTYYPERSRILTKS